MASGQSALHCVSFVTGAARAEELGLQPLKEILQEFGGWPVVQGDSWDEESFVWYNNVYEFRRVGYSIDYLIDFSITTDLKNSSYRTIDVSIKFAFL